MAGLETKEPQKPQMPNQVNKKTEQEILDYVVNFESIVIRRIYHFSRYASLQRINKIYTDF